MPSMPAPSAALDDEDPTRNGNNRALKSTKVNKHKNSIQRKSPITPDPSTVRAKNSQSSVSSTDSKRKSPAEVMILQDNSAPGDDVVIPAVIEQSSTKSTRQSRQRKKRKLKASQSPSSVTSSPDIATTRVSTQKANGSPLVSNISASSTTERSRTLCTKQAENPNSTKPDAEPTFNTSAKVTIESVEVSDQITTAEPSSESTSLLDAVQATNSHQNGSLHSDNSSDQSNTRPDAKENGQLEIVVVPEASVPPSTAAATTPTQDKNTTSNLTTPSSSTKKRARFNNVLFFEPSKPSSPFGNGLTISPNRNLTSPTKTGEYSSPFKLPSPTKQQNTPALSAENVPALGPDTSPSPTKLNLSPKSILKYPPPSPSSASPLASPSYAPPPFGKWNKMAAANSAKTQKVTYPISKVMVQSLEYLHTTETSNASKTNSKKISVTSIPTVMIDGHVKALEEIYSSTFNISSLVSLDAIFVASCVVLNYLQVNPAYSFRGGQASEENRSTYPESPSFEEYDSIKLKVQIYGATYILLKNRNPLISSPILRAYTPIFLNSSYNDLVAASNVFETISKSLKTQRSSNESGTTADGSPKSTGSSSSGVASDKLRLTLLSKLIGMIGKCIENMLNIRYSNDRSLTPADSSTRLLLPPTTGSGARSSNGSEDSKPMLIDISKKIFTHVIFSFSGKNLPKFIATSFIRLFLSKMARIALTPSMLHQFLVVINACTTGNNTDYTDGSSPNYYFSNSTLVEVLSIYRQFLVIGNLGVNGGNAIAQLAVKRRNYMLEHPNSWLPSVISRLVDPSISISSRALAVLEEVVSHAMPNGPDPNRNSNQGSISSFSNPKTPSKSTTSEPSNFVLPEAFCSCLLQIFERPLGERETAGEDGQMRLKKYFLFDMFKEYLNHAWTTKAVAIAQKPSRKPTSSQQNSEWSIDSSTSTNSSEASNRHVFVSNERAQHAFNIWRVLFRCLSATSDNGSSTTTSTDSISEEENETVSSIGDYLLFRWSEWRHWLALLYPHFERSQELYVYHESSESSSRLSSVSLDAPPTSAQVEKPQSGAHSSYNIPEIDEFRVKFLESLFFEWNHFGTMVMNAALNPPPPRARAASGLYFPFSEDFETQGLILFEPFRLVSTPPLHPLESADKPGSLIPEIIKDVEQVNGHLTQNSDDVFQTKHDLKSFLAQVEILSALRSSISKSLLFLVTVTRVAGLYPHDLSSWASLNPLASTLISEHAYDWIKIWDVYFLDFFELRCCNSNVPIEEVVHGLQFLLSKGVYNRNDLFTANRAKVVAASKPNLPENLKPLLQISHPYPQAAIKLVKLYQSDPTLLHTAIDEIGRAAIDGDVETVSAEITSPSNSVVSEVNNNISKSDIVGIAIIVCYKFESSIPVSYQPPEKSIFNESLTGSFYNSLISPAVAPKQPRANGEQRLEDVRLDALSKSSHDMSPKLRRDTCILLLRSLVSSDFGNLQLSPDVLGIFLDLISFCFSVFVRGWKDKDMMNEMLKFASACCDPFQNDASVESSETAWEYHVSFNIESLNFSVQGEQKESKEGSSPSPIVSLPFNVAFIIALTIASQEISTGLPSAPSVLRSPVDNNHSLSPFKTPTRRRLSTSRSLAFANVSAPSSPIKAKPTINSYDSVFEILEHSLIPYILDYDQRMSSDPGHVLSFGKHTYKSLFNIVTQILASVPYSSSFPILDLWMLFLETNRNLIGEQPESSMNTVFDKEENTKSLELLEERYSTLIRLYNSLVLQVCNRKDSPVSTPVTESDSDQSPTQNGSPKVTPTEDDLLAFEESFVPVIVSFLDQASPYINAAATASLLVSKKHPPHLSRNHDASNIVDVTGHTKRLSYLNSATRTKSASLRARNGHSITEHQPVEDGSLSDHEADDASKKPGARSKSSSFAGNRHALELPSDFNIYYCSIYVLVTVGNLISQVWSGEIKEQILLILTENSTKQVERAIIKQIYTVFEVLEQIFFQLDPSLNPNTNLPYMDLLVNGLPLLSEDELKAVESIFQLHCLAMHAYVNHSETLTEIASASEEKSAYIGINFMTSPITRRYSTNSNGIGSAVNPSRRSMVPSSHLKEFCTYGNTGSYVINALVYRFFPMPSEMIYVERPLGYLLNVIPHAYFTSLVQFCCDLPREYQRYESFAPEKIMVAQISGIKHMFKCVLCSFMVGKRDVALQIMDDVFGRNEKDPSPYKAAYPAFGGEAGAAAAAGIPTDPNHIKDVNPNTFDIRKFWWPYTTEGSNLKTLIKSSVFVEIIVASMCVDDFKFASLAGRLVSMMETSTAEGVVTIYNKHIDQGLYDLMSDDENESHGDRKRGKHKKTKKSTAVRNFALPPIILALLHLWHEKIGEEYPLKRSITCREMNMVTSPLAKTTKYWEYIDRYGAQSASIIEGLEFYTDQSNVEGDLRRNNDNPEAAGQEDESEVEEDISGSRVSQTQEIKPEKTTQEISTEKPEPTQIIEPVVTQVIDEGEVSQIHSDEIKVTTNEQQESQTRSKAKSKSKKKKKRSTGSVVVEIPAQNGSTIEVVKKVTGSEESPGKDDLEGLEESTENASQKSDELSSARVRTRSRASQVGVAAAPTVSTPSTTRAHRKKSRKSATLNGDESQLATGEKEDLPAAKKEQANTLGEDSTDGSKTDASITNGTLLGKRKRSDSESPVKEDGEKDDTQEIQSSTLSKANFISKETSDGDSRAASPVTDSEKEEDEPGDDEGLEEDVVEIFIPAHLTAGSSEDPMVISETESPDLDEGLVRSTKKRRKTKTAEDVISSLELFISGCDGESSDEEEQEESTIPEELQYELEARLIEALQVAHRLRKQSSNSARDKRVSGRVSK